MNEQDKILLSIVFTVIGVLIWFQIIFWNQNNVVPIRPS